MINLNILKWIYYLIMGGKEMIPKNLMKIIFTGVLIIFFGATVLSGASIQTENIYNSTKNMKPLGRNWAENFDSYISGQFLDGTPDDGGWKGWDNDTSFGAYVKNFVSLSSPNSVEIIDIADLVHEFSGYDSGQWTFTAWQYIPSDYIGDASFLLLNTYTDGGAHQNNHWSNAVTFDSLTGNVKSWEGNTLPIIFDDWVEIRVEINFDTDYQDIYYGGALLVGKSWTGGVEPGGALNLACVDLYSGPSQSTEIYYDDLSLTEGFPPKPSLCCNGELRLEDVTPGSTVTGSFTVENCGDSETGLNWEVSDYPEWGSEWAFTPPRGTDLTPEAGPVTVDVSFVAPSDSETEFNGEIKVINSDNPSNFCNIDVYILTPRNRGLNHTLLCRIFERFPKIFPIFQQLLGI